MTQQIDCVALYSVPAFLSVKVEMNTRACVESYEGYQIPRHFCLMSLLDAGMQQAGGPGGLVPPHFLADQLTLSQPGGHIIPTQCCVPPRFLTLAACLGCHLLLFFVS